METNDKTVATQQGNDGGRHRNDDTQKHRGSCSEAVGPMGSCLPACWSHAFAPPPPPATPAWPCTALRSPASRGAAGKDGQLREDIVRAQLLFLAGLEQQYAPSRL